jgi:hypothetical protein
LTIIKVPEIKEGSEKHKQIMLDNDIEGVLRRKHSEEQAKEDAAQREAELKEKIKNMGYDLDSGAIGKTKNIVFQSVPCLIANEVAKTEADIWDSNNWYEQDLEALPYLRKYWESCIASNSRWADESKWRNYRQKKEVKEHEHWSAAFITWVMQHENGMGAKWDDSARHRSYLGKAWRRRKKIEKDPEAFKGQIVYIAFSGNEIVGNGRSSDNGRGRPAGEGGTIMLEPGDVIGAGSAHSNIHMDVFIGDGRKVGGNTRGGGRGYCPPGKRKSSGYCGTSGRQAANTGKTTDVIKRVKIIGAVDTLKYT